MTTTTAPSTADQLIAHFTAKGVDADMARSIIEACTEEQLTETLASITRTEEERDALRKRLAASPELRAALCPASTWKDADARFDVTQRALRLAQATADRSNVTLEALCAQLIAGHGTIQDTIDTHGTDPRLDSFGSGAFYAFRWRLKDAIDELLSEERRAEALRLREAQDAAWARQGLARCTRCDGQGGRKEWPGFDCFDCGGHGAL